MQLVVWVERTANGRASLTVYSAAPLALVCARGAVCNKARRLYLRRAAHEAVLVIIIKFSRGGRATATTTTKQEHFAFIKSAQLRGPLVPVNRGGCLHFLLHNSLAN